MEYTLTVVNEEGHENLKLTIDNMPDEWTPSNGQYILVQALFGMDDIVKASGGNTMEEIIENMVEAYEEGWIK